MEIETQISQRVNGRTVTARQIEALSAVQSEGSKTAAAKKLGISVPVIHRYIEGIEESTGMKMIRSTPGGSVLTDDGRKIVESAKMMELRCTECDSICVSCTPVTEELMMSVLSSLKIDADLTISDDLTNIRCLKEGRTDMILLDDPVHLFDLDGYQWAEVGSMDMVHVDRGRSYLQYRYGAQRIAFMHLDAAGKEYSIDGRTMSIKDLMASGKSFFVDEILLVREGIRIKSATEPRLLRHTINAVYRKGADCVSPILNEILSRNSIT